MFGSAVLTALVNRSCVDLRILNVAHVGACPWCRRRTARALRPRRSPTGACPDSAAPGCPGTARPASRPGTRSTSGSRRSDCGVPPTTPLAIPPATPLPVKSSSFVTFFERSMSGRTSGILIGAVSTWKPFGGGAFMTTSGGGGFGASFGGGGSSFLTVTKSTFSAFGFSSASLACSVPYTAA